MVWTNPNIPGAGFTSGELILHGAVLLLLLISLFSIAAAAFVSGGNIVAAAVLTSIAVVGNLIVNFIVILTDFMNADSTIWEFLGDIGSLILALIAAITIFDGILTVLVYSLFVATLVAESAAKIACPAVWATTAAITIVTAFFAIDNAIKDWQD